MVLAGNYYFAAKVLAGNYYLAAKVLAGNCYSSVTVLAGSYCYYSNNSFLLCGRLFAAVYVVVSQVVVDAVAMAGQHFQFHPVDSCCWGSSAHWFVKL